MKTNESGWQMTMFKAKGSGSPQISTTDGKIWAISKRANIVRAFSVIIDVSFICNP